MTQLLAIDPGDRVSAYVIIDAGCRPVVFDKLPNEQLRDAVEGYSVDQVVIEMIGHYGTGMPAGTTVFETCLWIGRFIEQLRDVTPVPSDPELTKRQPVKLHLCGSPKAKDSNVRQALVDRFAPGTSNYGKGSKAEPGWFYGFHRDVWQAYALAVYAMDMAAGESAAA